MKTGIELIAIERARHAEEGWTPEHDDTHTQGELAIAGACYAAGKPHVHVEALANSARGMEEAGYVYDRTQPKSGQLTWPFDAEWWKPRTRIRDLVRAGSFIAAEIDRLQRLNGKKRARR